MRCIVYVKGNGAYEFSLNGQIKSIRSVGCDFYFGVYDKKPLWKSENKKLEWEIETKAQEYVHTKTKSWAGYLNIRKYNFTLTIDNCSGVGKIIVDYEDGNNGWLNGQYLIRW